MHTPEAYKVLINSRKNLINTRNKVLLKVIMNVGQQTQEILKSQLAGSQNWPLLEL